MGNMMENIMGTVPPESWYKPNIFFSEKNKGTGWLGFLFAIVNLFAFCCSCFYLGIFHDTLW